MDHRLNKRCTLENVVDGDHPKYNDSVVLNNERALIEECAEADAHHSTQRIHAQSQAQARARTPILAYSPGLEGS